MRHKLAARRQAEWGSHDTHSPDCWRLGGNAGRGTAVGSPDERSAYGAVRRSRADLKDLIAARRSKVSEASAALKAEKKKAAELAARAQTLKQLIDRLAAEGLRFTQAYAGATVCAPSRCCLMTGKHTGHATVRGNKKPEVGLGVVGT